MNHVRVRVCSPFQSYSIFRKQASVREDGLKKLGYPTTNGETLHFDHEKYPWICSDVISQKNKSHLENSEGRERIPEWNCTSFQVKGPFRSGQYLDHKSRQNTWHHSWPGTHTEKTAPLIQNHWKQNSRCVVNAYRLTVLPLQQNVIQKDRWLRSAFWRLIFGKWLSKYTGPQFTWFWGKESLTLTIPKTSDCKKNALDEILKNCFF